MSQRFIMKEAVIEIRDLTKIYVMGNQKLIALNSVSFDIYRNDYIALMGPSGSGKSTLMNLIGCLDSPTSGEYYLNHTNVSQMTDNELAYIRNKEIGFVFQTFNLLPKISSLDNVAIPLIYAGLGKKERLEKAAYALEQVGLVDRMSHKPNELSGGQRQRVAIARAIVNNPSIILADEPTGNLDTKTSIEVMEIFNDIHQKGNTVVLVTHEPDIAEYAWRVLNLRDGKIENDVVTKTSPLVH